MLPHPIKCHVLTGSQHTEAEIALCPGGVAYRDRSMCFLNMVLPNRTAGKHGLTRAARRRLALMPTLTERV